MLRRRGQQTNLLIQTFTSTIFIPIFGESAVVFGRRWPTIFAVALFVLGSGVAGGATSTAMLIGTHRYSFLAALAA